jgi:hypothetical protein
MDAGGNSKINIIRFDGAFEHKICKNSAPYFRCLNELLWQLRHLLRSAYHHQIYSTLPPDLHESFMIALATAIDGLPAEPTLEQFADISPDDLLGDPEDDVHLVLKGTPFVVKRNVLSMMDKVRTLRTIDESKSWDSPVKSRQERAAKEALEQQDAIARSSSPPANKRARMKPPPLT